MLSGTQWSEASPRCFATLANGNYSSEHDITTNLKGSIDQAFLRRIRFIVQFPFPDATQRAEIWRRVFPRNTPTEGLDFAKLAKLSVARGNIRTIALNAAFIAAGTGEPVEMKHILQATKSEYLKLERSLTDSEIKGRV